MRRLAFGAVLILLGTVPLLTAGRTRAVRPPQPERPLSGSRSFEVTDQAIVSAFPLARVLEQLIARSGVTTVTPQQLIRQMFDTQNPRPGRADLAGPHCDDTIIDGVPSFNGFPRRCPTPEGILAATPYMDGEWYPMAVVNRFDVSPADGSNCGQYRIVYARRENDPLRIERLHLIFEAVLPNPHPEAGLAACRPVAQFWAGLSSVDSMDERRTRIEKFFFDGIEGFTPAIDPVNFAEPGGIRTLQQVFGPPANRFYQFRFAKQCSDGDCTVRMIPDVLENSPFGLLFDGRTNTPTARAFRDDFIRHVATLAVGDVNLFSMAVPRQFLMAESNPIADGGATAYPIAFDNGRTSSAGNDFRNRIQAELTRVGSPITPENVMERASFESCFGCHGLNGAVPLGGGLKLPFSPNFGAKFISEDNMEDGEAGPGTRFRVDPIITTLFLPHRMQILRDFLDSGKAPEHSK
jgi:hypothetical protein